MDLILTEVHKGQLTSMSGGQGTPNKLDLLGFLEGRGWGLSVPRGLQPISFQPHFQDRRPPVSSDFTFPRAEGAAAPPRAPWSREMEWLQEAGRGGSGYSAGSPIALLRHTAVLTCLTLLTWSQQGVSKQMPSVKFCPALGGDECKGRLAVSQHHGVNHLCL